MKAEVNQGLHREVSQDYASLHIQRTGAVGLALFDVKGPSGDFARRPHGIGVTQDQDLSSFALGRSVLRSSQVPFCAKVVAYGALAEHLDGCADVLQMSHHQLCKGIQGLLGVTGRFMLHKRLEEALHLVASLAQMFKQGCHGCPFIWTGRGDLLQKIASGRR